MIATLPTLVRTIVPPGTVLTVDEAAAIMRTAFLAAEIDLDEDPAERRSLDALNREVWQAAGVPLQPLPLVSPLPIDQEARLARIGDLAGNLTSTPARELAYVAAHVLAVVDLHLAGVERSLLAELRRALGLDEQRANALVAHALELMTPGVGEAAGS